MSVRVRILLLVLAVLAALSYGVATYDRPENDRAAVTIDSTAPRFSSVAELVAASDEIVLAEVVDTAPGRVIGTLRTELVELSVVEILKGVPGTPLVLEQEKELTDGTPVRVDDVAPVVAGQRGVFFLVRSPEADVAYRALVGPQGRFLADGNALDAAVDDSFTRRIVAAGGPALVAAIRREV